MKRVLFVLSVLAVLSMLVSSAAALSDSEYKEMMKDPNFAKTEKELSSVWAEAKAKLSKEHFEHLQNSQREWLSKTRDEYAENVMKSDPKLSRVQAYTTATEDRIDDIKSAIWASSMKPEDADRVFTMHTKGDNGYTVDMTHDDKTGTVTADFYAWGSQKSLWKAEGKLSGNVLTVSNDKGSAVITFWDLDTISVKTGEKLKSNGISIDGTYTPQPRTYE